MDAVLVSVVVVGAALVVAIVLQRVYGRRMREGFATATSSMSIFDLSEFAALPTDFRETLRGATAKMAGALTVKLADMYKTNPEYVRSTVDSLTNLGIATIMTYSVPAVPTAATAAPTAATAATAAIATHTMSNATPLTASPDFGSTFMPIESPSSSLPPLASSPPPAAKATGGPFIEPFA